MIPSSADDMAPDALRLNLVLVRKDRRRNGIATAMLARLLAEEDAAPARFVAPTAPALADWLTRCGFVQVADILFLERLLPKTVQVAPPVAGRIRGPLRRGGGVRRNDPD
jgi:hypothetical protein